MKMPNFSLAFLLAMVYPAVLLAVRHEKYDNYNEEGDDDDFYSGSGSGSGSGSSGGLQAKFTTDYPAAPSTSSSSQLSSSQDLVKDLSTIPVLPDLHAVDTTTSAIMTSRMPSTTIPKDFDHIVPETRANNFRPRIVDIKHDTTVAAPHTSNAGPKVPSKLPDHTTAIIKDESLTVSHVLAENGNEKTTTVAVEKTAEIENQHSPIVDDIFIIDETEETNGGNQILMQDHKSLMNTPNDNYLTDYSTSGSFLERRELLAAAVVGGLVGLMIAVLLVVLLVYRMKKKDEGSYTLDEAKQPNGGYQKPKKQEEFYA